MLEEILKLIAGMAGLGAFTSMLNNLLKVAGNTNLLFWKLVILKNV